MLCRESLQMFDCADCYRGTAGRALFVRTMEAALRIAFGPASNKQDQAFNGLARAGQLQNVCVKIAKSICPNCK